MTSPLLNRPGAAELQEDPRGLDAAGVAWHYGNPLGEQRAAQRGTALVDRSQRPVIAVSGPDSATLLNNLLSQKLDDAAEGFSASALDLDMQGHILHHADATRVGDTFYLDVPASQADSLIDYLRKMVFWSQVEIERTHMAILTLLGTTLPVPEQAVFSREAGWGSVHRVDVAVPRDELGAVVKQLEAEGAQLAGLMAYTAERVKELEPELGIDLDERSIPHEAPTLVDNAVHLHKGCYRGQETVARVDNLGKSPRLLVMLQLDGSAPALPNPGDTLTVNGRKVGRLGTVVHDCDYGPIALGLVKRSALDAGDLQILPGNDEQGSPVSASIDPDSIRQDEGPRPGRVAVDKLRGRQ